MTSPKEKGQSTEGVHHSEVSALLFRKADEGEMREESMGGREKQRKRLRGGGLFNVCVVIGYQPKVCHGPETWLAATE